MRFFHKNDARKLQAMLIQAVIIGSVFATSLLSGILGMAGGMILMAVLVALLPVATAMVLHGDLDARRQLGLVGRTRPSPAGGDDRDQDRRSTQPRRCVFDPHR